MIKPKYRLIQTYDFTAYYWVQVGMTQGFPTAVYMQKSKFWDHSYNHWNQHPVKWPMARETES